MTTRIEEAMDEASRWADIPGVVSVGQGRKQGRDVIEVRITTSRAELGGKIPAVLQGIPVEIIERETPISIQKKSPDKGPPPPRPGR